VDYTRQALYAPYRCLDGKFLIMVVINDQQFAALCRALDLEHLIDDPDFSDNLKRTQRSVELRELIEGILATKTREAWLSILERHDLAAAPILERDEVFDHPQIRDNEMLTFLEHPMEGQVEMVNVPVRLSETPGGLRRPAPLLGQHTEEVLGELGYNAARIQQLRDQKVVG
jgi:crotonobetainyl-CoA:carnitine CoA-transferase CaiB-like acyl-CoA transferase